MLDEEGKFAKTEIEKDGKKMLVNHVVGAAWSDAADTTALLKFEDGSKAKLMPLSALKKHRDAAAGTADKAPPPPASKPAAPAAPAAKTSRFSKPK